ncbi:MAG: hypothetical protein ACKV0T_20100 [Planctomycetales bacterium]
MAKCERGYLCDVCGDEVAEIVDSDLYLSYVIGLVEPRELSSRPERHIRCNPVQAQFIVDERFPPVAVTGPFDKRLLDPASVASQERLVTRGWQRLQEIAGQSLPLAEYPLPEVRERRTHDAIRSRS